ncbi:hypothetical protein ACF0H5_016596 [Mactra antiquata]
MLTIKVRYIYVPCLIFFIFWYSGIISTLHPRHLCSEATKRPPSKLENSSPKRGSLRSSLSVKTIQWYDQYHSGHGLRCKSKDVDFRKCEYKTCRLLDHYIVQSQNGGSKQERPLAADAVIFQGVHTEELVPPERRDSDQVFVFAERETWWHLGMIDNMMKPSTPFKTLKHSDVGFLSSIIPDVFVSTQIYKNVMKFRSVFNWTMTYRLDSDIPMLYGRIVKPKPTSKIGKQENFHKIYDDKRADVVWLVSHCITKSKREFYVNELKKYISIDIYGACGDKECPKREGAADVCIEMIVKKYKFVLSFENTFHTDYVTEKLFDWFPRNIIPVVYGMANYSRIAPPGTIINAAEYNSPMELAEFLQYVGSNRKLYLNYLRKKSEYIVHGHKEMQQKAYCQLCEWLHDLESHRKSYSSIYKWWQLNDTSKFSKLYNQAVFYEPFRIKYRLTAVLIVICVLLYMCVCKYVRNLIMCVPR